MEERINGEKGIWISIIAYIGLSILKIIAGYSAHSDALLADGLNNSTDILASLAVLIGLKISKKPADHDHAYGHSRAEMVAALIASFIMFTVGVQVFFQAVRTLFSSRYKEPDLFAAWIASFGALVMFIVYLYNRNLGKKLNSQAIMAAAKDNLSDAGVSIGTAAGIIATQFGLPWLDPVVALIIGGLILWTAWEIFREASHTLTDGFDSAKLTPYIRTIEQISGVEKVEEIRARSHGNEIFLEVTIKVKSHLNVIESHQISDEIEQEMRRIHQVSNVVVHVEPDLD